MIKKKNLAALTAFFCVPNILRAAYIDKAHAHYQYQCFCSAWVVSRQVSSRLDERREKKGKEEKRRKKKRKEGKRRKKKRKRRKKERKKRINEGRGMHAEEMCVRKMRRNHRNQTPAEQCAINHPPPAIAGVVHHCQHQSAPVPGCPLHVLLQHIIRLFQTHTSIVPVYMHIYI